MHVSKCDNAHGRPLQSGAPAVGALGETSAPALAPYLRRNTAMDENRCALKLHFQVS